MGIVQEILLHLVLEVGASLELLLQALRIRHHRAKFEDRNKCLPPLPHPFVTEEDRSAGIEFDEKCQEKEKRGEDDEKKKCEQEIRRALIDRAPSIERGGVKAEDRD